MTGSCGVVSLRLESELLRDNPLGDPYVREVEVLTPPGYTPTQRWPVVFWLAGFGSRGRDLLAGHLFTDGLPQLLGAAMTARLIPEALIVLPDCATRYGGSQYIDSARCGLYQSYLVDEVVPFVDSVFTTRGAGRRAVLGKSSGGYGAIMAAMARPGIFDAVCAHSPDACFEFSYLALLPKAMDTFAATGGFGRFADDPRAVVPKDGAYMIAMSLLAMAVCYAPTADGDLAEIFLCDPRTGLFRDEVWRRWLDHDPVRLVATHAAALKKLSFFFLDVGRRDDYAMHWGARALHHALRLADVQHEYDEHDGGHHGIEHRFLRSLAMLAKNWGS